MAGKSSKDEYKIIKALGATMTADGFELAIFRFVLDPRCKNLPKDKLLHELYCDHMVPLFGKEAVKYLWFVVNVIGTINVDPLKSLLHGTFTVANGEVLYRKLLAEIALELGSTMDRSKRFIQFVVSTRQLEDVSSTVEYMPPEEKQQNNKAFVPYILKIFKEADDQCIIAPDDLESLQEWLKECTEKKLARKVKQFKDQDFTKNFPIHAQCSQEDASSSQVVGSGDLSSSGPTAGSLESSNHLKKLGSSVEESEGEKDESGQVKKSEMATNTVKSP